jgi:hypothetical protein
MSRPYLSPPRREAANGLPTKGAAARKSRLSDMGAMDPMTGRIASRG